MLKGIFMAKLRTAGIVAALAAASLLVSSVGTAEAQAPPLTKKVAVTGTAKNGKAFKGTYTIRRFIERDGAVWAVGRLSGTVGKRHVTRRGVKMLAKLEQVAQAATQPIPTPAPARS